MIMVGATLIGMGTSVYYRDAKVFREVAEEMAAWGKKRGIKNLREIHGTAHAGKYSKKFQDYN